MYRIACDEHFMKSRRRLRCVSAVAIALFACASQAEARQWNYVAKSDDGLVTFYGDRKSTAVQGTLRRMWMLYDYQQVQQDPDTFVETRSIVSLASFDCRNRKLGTIQSTNYAGNMGKGKAVVKSVPLSAREIHYVNAAPGSIDEKVLTFACTLPDRRGS